MLRSRVFYVSATDATDVSNPAYGARLGLWEAQTAFASHEIFVGQRRQGGMAVIELVAHDLKALGLYTSRALSFDGVAYDSRTTRSRASSFTRPKPSA